MVAGNEEQSTTKNRGICCIATIGVKKKLVFDECKIKLLVP
jgi:hypothetical protein